MDFPQGASRHKLPPPLARSRDVSARRARPMVGRRRAAARALEARQLVEHLEPGNLLRYLHVAPRLHGARVVERPEEEIDDLRPPVRTVGDRRAAVGAKTALDPGRGREYLRLAAR